MKSMWSSTFEFILNTKFQFWDVIGRKMIPCWPRECGVECFCWKCGACEIAYCQVQIGKAWQGSPKVPPPCVFFSPCGVLFTLNQYVLGHLSLATTTKRRRLWADDFSSYSWYSVPIMTFGTCWNLGWIIWSGVEPNSNTLELVVELGLGGSSLMDLPYWAVLEMGKAWPQIFLLLIIKNILFLENIF